MRQYDKCEKYCKEVIDKLVAAQQEVQMASTNGGDPLDNIDTTKLHTNKSIKFVDDDYEQESGDPVHSLLEYRSKVHFSLAYLLKKYFKRHDEAREQYEKSIETGL